jgi:hypothetical protein
MREKTKMKVAVPEALRKRGSQVIEKTIREKFKCNTAIQINKAVIKFLGKNAHVHLEVDLEMDKGELLRRIGDKLGDKIGKKLKKHKKEE